MSIQINYQQKLHGFVLYCSYHTYICRHNHENIANVFIQEICAVICYCMVIGDTNTEINRKLVSVYSRNVIYLMVDRLHQEFLNGHTNIQNKD